MISKRLLNILEDNNFTYCDNEKSDLAHACGIFGGYFVTVYEVSNNATLFFNFRFPDNDENDKKRKSLSEALSNEKQKFSITHFSVSQHGLKITSSVSAELITELLAWIASLLDSNDIRGIKYCSNCGNKFGSRHPKKITDGKENYLMCEHCAARAKDILKDVKPNQSQDNKGTFGKGIFGSVIFSLIGAVIYIIFYYFIAPYISRTEIGDMKYVYCSLGFLVAYLSYAGYRIFCKKIGTSSYVTISVSALLCTAIGQYLGVVFGYIANNDNLKLSMLFKEDSFWLIHLRNTVPTNSYDSFTDYSEVFYKLLGISTLFCIVGIAIFLLTLQDKKNVKEESIKIETFKI